MIFSDSGVPFRWEYEFKIGWTLAEEKFLLTALAGVRS